jgi:outer membrane protease
MKKSIAGFSVFVCLVLCPPLGADTFPYTLSLSPQFGFLYGQGEELVYQSAASDQLLSQLLWDLKPLWYGGIKMEFARRNPLAGFGFFSTLSMKFGFPMVTGIMEDRDWQGPAGEYTNYSRHDALSNGALILDLAAGPSIPIGSILALRPSLGFSYTRLSWTGQDGYRHYGQELGGNNYAPLEDSDPRVPVSGPVVSYSQEWICMPLGFSLQIMPGRRFSGILWFHAGPIFKFQGLDEHHIKSIQFRDEIRGGYFLEPGGEFRFSFGEHFSLRIYGSWRRFAGKSHGKAYSRPIGGGAWNFQSNTAGGNLQTADLGLGIEVRF